MAEPWQAQHPIDPQERTTHAVVPSSEPELDDWLNKEPNSASLIANRVCTPLGLFTHPSETNRPITMPQTLTPESTPASPSKLIQSKSPVRQAGTSPTRSTMIPSDCMRKRTDSITNILRNAASATSTQSPVTEGPSPLVPEGEMTPLHTGTVLANTKIVHPKPISRTPVDVTSRPGTASSVVQLELTAQQLSMTSSIDDAIRDLHCELKRSDSRRSSILAASVKNWDDSGAMTPSQIKRHLSTSSSIVSTNIAARQGGYSPAAFVKSPTASMTGRLIPGSLTSASYPEADGGSAMSRHGPGKSSVRSVRSAKLSLADISESEPIALTQDVLDEADCAPPIELQPVIQEVQVHESITENVPNTDAFHQMMQGGNLQSAYSYSAESNEMANSGREIGRLGSSHSQDTYHQAQHAFYDFDGVHCPDNEAEPEEHAYLSKPKPTELENDSFDPEMEEDEFELLPLELPAVQPFAHPPEYLTNPPPPVGLVRPQSYIDPASGVQMNYYPARVPAALNIPQKLSNRPKANQRNARHSKVLSAMMDSNYQPEKEDTTRRASAMPALGSTFDLAEGPISMNERHHERRPSYLPLSSQDLKDVQESIPEHTVRPAQETHENLASTLRIPKRISDSKIIDKRKSRMSMMGNIPSQLRASAYFDAAATTTDLEVKDGSAMHALDDILDASAGAPVSAFTDHLYAGKLGSEVYGPIKKKSVASSPSIGPPSAEPEVKKRSSLMWLTKRSHSYNSQESPKLHSNSESPRPGDEDNSDHVIRVPAGPLDHSEEHEHGEEEQGEEAAEEYMGPPTTLLAELQLRKQQQKERIQNKVINANGMQATLLELDAIAETQRVDRKSKRVNLVWEDPDTHLDQNGSDDEDVPLAIIAARQQGAKNMADLERPIGLIEKREIEENEPLSRRRARLQGLDTSFTTPRPQSMLLAPSRLGDTRPRQSMIFPDQTPLEDDIEDETLADRRKRLASEAEKEKELSLPPTRPVSTAFSAELLSQFDPLEAGKQEDNAAQKDVKGAPEEEETLGQRRARLQAEKTARLEEMAHGAATGTSGQSKDRRMSLASVLSAHPRKSQDLRVQEMQRQEENERLAREQEAKLAALRLQMPSTLSVPGFGQQAGFNGGAFNNGYGGLPGAYQRPISAHVAVPNHFNRPNSMMLNNGQFQQGVYMHPYQTGSAHAFGAKNMYNNGGNGVYGGGIQPSMQMPTQMPHNAGSLDRVEVWRQSVYP